MARIDSLGEPFQHPVPDKKKAGRKEKAQRKSFSRMVESAGEGREAAAEDFEDGGGRSGIEELLDAVFASGDALKKAPTIESIRDYRRKVKEFITWTVNHSVAVEETTSGNNILKRKRFTILKVVDEKLEALAASVLAAQKEQFALLAQIDEINGLLVDLVS